MTVADAVDVLRESKRRWLVRGPVQTALAIIAHESRDKSAGTDLLACDTLRRACDMRPISTMEASGRLTEDHWNKAIVSLGGAP